MTETFKGFMIGLLFGVAGTVCLCKRYYEHVIEETVQAEREQAAKDAEQAREEATDKNAEHYYNEMKMYDNLVKEYGPGVAKDIKLSREMEIVEEDEEEENEEVKFVDEEEIDETDRSMLDFIPDDREYKGYMDPRNACYSLDILDVMYGDQDKQNEHYWKVISEYADLRHDDICPEDCDTVHLAWGILTDPDSKKYEPLACDHKAFEMNGYQTVVYEMYTDDILTNENGVVIPEELKPILLPEEFDNNFEYDEKEDKFIAYFINRTIGLAIKLVLRDCRYDEEVNK